MRNLLRSLFVIAATLTIASGSFAQSSALDFPKPGESMGDMVMTESIFSLFFTDAAGETIREEDDFMSQLESMSSDDRAMVNQFCTQMEIARASFSDRVSSLCRAAGGVL